MKVTYIELWSRSVLTGYSYPSSKKVSRVGDCMYSFSGLVSPLKKDRIPDGKVCLNQLGELAVTKFAVEPVSAIKLMSFYHLFDVDLATGMVSSGSCRTIRHWYVRRIPQLIWLIIKR